MATEPHHLPTVAVSIPLATPNIHVRCVESLLGLLTRQCANLQFATVESASVAENRNRLVKRALDSGADYVLFVDSDMSFPPDALERLLADDRDIVGAVYVQRAEPYSPVMCPLDNAPIKGFVPPLLEVSRLGCGLMLISRRVFGDSVDPWLEPWFMFGYDKNSGTIISEDYYFCDRARKRDFSIWADIELSTMVTHWGACGSRWTGGATTTFSYATQPHAPRADAPSQ